MPEWLLLVLGLALAASFVLLPLLRPDRTAAPADDQRDAALLRHRVALEALRDVENDRRAGSLDDAGYATQLAEAEANAAATRAALDRTGGREVVPRASTSRPAPAMIGFGAIAAVLLIGSLVPATGVANTTLVNEALAEAQAAEQTRQDRIAGLLEQLAQDPEDVETLSDLADAYLAGSTQDDLVRGATALRLIIELEPERADAYERIIEAYLRAGDHANARAALDAYAQIEAADPIEVAFLDGIIALRGEDDAAAAVDAFDRFLELAPDDPRAEMVRDLRDEAAQSP